MTDVDNSIIISNLDGLAWKLFHTCHQHPAFRAISLLPAILKAMPGADDVVCI